MQVDLTLETPLNGPNFNTRLGCRCLQTPNIVVANEWCNGNRTITSSQQRRVGLKPKNKNQKIDNVCGGR
jgi:hypothetical protein